MFLWMAMLWAQDYLMIEKTVVGTYIATVNGVTYPCVVGKNGITTHDLKTEGDGCTPSGTYALGRTLFFRQDKIDAKVIDHGGFLLRGLHQWDAWCDDVESPLYNQHFKLSSSKQNPDHEKLYRDDHLYDVILVIDYNTQPVIKGKGSAIFIHVARNLDQGTEGCIAFELKDLLEIIPHLSQDSKIVIKN